MYAPSVCFAVCAAVLGLGTASRGQESASLAPKIVGELHAAEDMMAQALKGHPDLIKKEMQYLHGAEAAAADVDKRQQGADAAKPIHASVLQETTSVKALDELRQRTLDVALREERNYGTAEQHLAEDGKRIMSGLSTVEDAIASAFSGKDGDAVKTAMKAGTLLEKAREKQQEITQANEQEAATMDKRVSLLAAQSARNKAAQEERAFTSGMSNLAKDEQAAVSQLSSLKGAVAQAFAGKDSKAVEEAMEVGELLDKARSEQQEIAARDGKVAVEAPRLFSHLSNHKQQERPQHHHNAEASAAAKGAALTQATSKSSEIVASMMSARARHVKRLKGLAFNEQHILRETSRVKNLLESDLGGAGAPAAAVEKEALAMLSQAREAEQRAFDTTAMSAARASA